MGRQWYFAGIYERRGEDRSYHAGTGLRIVIPSAACGDGACQHAGGRELCRICRNVPPALVGSGRFRHIKREKRNGRFPGDDGRLYVCLSALFAGVRIVTIRTADAPVLCTAATGTGQIYSRAAAVLCLCSIFRCKFFSGTVRICRTGDLGRMGDHCGAAQKVFGSTGDCMDFTASHLSVGERCSVFADLRRGREHGFT